MTSPAPKQTVLLVDDERNLVRVLEARLRREGYNTLAAFDGAEALTTLRHYPIHAVVLDIRMSGLGGQETLMAMRAIRPDLPVVLMSAYGKPDGLADFVTYLEKPFNLDMLVSAVGNALNTRRAAAPPAMAFALFAPGQPVRLVVPDGDNLCYGAGWVQNETPDAMEVNAPVREGRAVVPPEGAAVRVTLTGRDALYSFNTRVRPPLPGSAGGTLTLAKPDIIERHQRRASSRRVASLPVRLDVLPPDAPSRPLRLSTPWESVNLSDHGMMIAGDANVPKDSAVLFTVSMPETNRAVQGRARVIWDAATPSRRFTLGLEFTSFPETDRRALRAYLDSLAPSIA